MPSTRRAAGPWLERQPPASIGDSAAGAYASRATPGWRGVEAVECPTLERVRGSNDDASSRSSGTDRGRRPKRHLIAKAGTRHGPGTQPGPSPEIPPDQSAGGDPARRGSGATTGVWGVISLSGAQGVPCTDARPAGADSAPVGAASAGTTCAPYASSVGTSASCIR